MALKKVADLASDERLREILARIVNEWATQRWNREMR